jgi:catalase-peroxidase
VFGPRKTVFDPAPVAAALAFFLDVPADNVVMDALTDVQRKWSYLEPLFRGEWTLMNTPAGARDWIPIDPAAATLVPDAHDSSKRHAPVMTTADLALRFDPIYEPIARHFLENPDEFADAFAKAWFKLTHRDLGPKARYHGVEVPAEDFIWQDPVPAVDHPLVDAADIASLKEKVLASGLTVSELVATAWASAATFRGTDRRGGAGARRPQQRGRCSVPMTMAAPSPSRCAARLQPRDNTRPDPC